jgi:CubicO group peptidase (beta-lactamase class C family)
MAEVHGSCDERFASVRDTFAASFDAGKDVGACVSVVHDGRTVVDLWGGTIDDEGTPWAEDTIINVWSTTKTMTALAALVLADRGELDLHAPVATYWPEFKANGKENVTTAHLLSHAAGLSGWEEPMQPADLYDWDLACGRLAAQAPWWEPGTASGYHAVTQGYLVGEVVRRVSGRTVGTFFAEEIAGPLGADFHIGTRPEHDHRVARVIPPTTSLDVPDDTPPERAAILAKTFGNPQLDASQSWEEAWRRAEIPAAGGHGNARSVARVQSVLSHGGEVDGVRILSAEGCERALEEQVSGPDIVFGLPMTFGMGFGLSTAEMPIAPNPRACFWGGWGGSVVINDFDARLTVAYVMNRMGEGTTGDDRGIGIAFAAFASVMGA